MTIGNMGHPAPDGNGNLVVATVEGEPRILDTDLAARLGFSQVRDIRKIIARYQEALLRMGRCATVAHRPERGGKEEQRYYLNRKQAIFITAKSETQNATDITIEIIERFDAYERGSAKPADPMQILNDPAAMRGLLLTYSEKVMTLQAEVQAMAPDVAAYKRIANTDGLLNLTEAAKVLGQQPKAFNRWLSVNRYVYRRPGGSLLAYQDRIQSGYLEHKLVLYQKPDGSDGSRDQVMVTRRGISHFAKKLGVSLPDDLFGHSVAAE